MSGILPTPAPAEPLFSAPGHWEHHRWLESALQALASFPLGVAADWATTVALDGWTPGRLEVLYEGSGAGWEIDGNGALPIPPGAGGLYTVFTRCNFSNNANGYRTVQYFVNGEAATPETRTTLVPASATVTRQQTTTLLRLVEGDVIQPAVFVAGLGGTSVNFTGGSFGMLRVGA